MLEGHIDEHFNLQSVEPYDSFLGSKPVEPTMVQYYTAQTNGKTARPLILHSSGTTGFPKPIPLSARYPLQYAACHEFAPDEEINWVNLSTLPLYHGFGFLAPCLSLSVGMTCCFPPSHIIPAGESTRDLLEAFDCRSLMTVPSIVDDLLALGESANCLRSLKFLAVGGGALGPAQGTRLVEQGVKLLSHYGVTEIGALAPIFCPGPDYNWRFLRLRSDLGLELKPIQGSDRFKLVGWLHGWDGPFEIQDELERNVDGDPRHTEIRILGRTDDLIVLKTGEKVMPQHLEAALIADPAIKTAVCVGDGYFEVVVLIEAENSHPALDMGQFVDHVWELIATVNADLDSHARVSSKSAIIVKPAQKRIPRTDKGSVSRRQMYDVFENEIKVAYAAIENERPRISIDIGSVEASIVKMVGEVFANHSLDLSRDLFEQGMDSLQALRLSRMIDSATRRKSSNKGHKATAQFIYRHPSIEKLSAAVSSLILGGSEVQPNGGPDNHARMLSRLQQYTQPDTLPNCKSKPQDTVLLTGATGSLGAHVLEQLTSSRKVRKVICVYRQKPSKILNKNSSNPASHLKAALGSNGIVLDDNAWAKVEMIEDVELIAQHAGRHGHTNGHSEKSSRQACSQIAANITHIIHLAWPMDFHRTLESFDPHLQMLKTLIDLARFKDDPQRPKRNSRVRLLFASSIAVVRNFNDGTRVPETVMKSPATVAPMGYAEAKWICEHMIANAAQEFGQDVDPVAIRIGQLSGPENSSGVWKTGEHIPALVRASHKVGAFPDLPGVSPSILFAKKSRLVSVRLMISQTLSWIPVDRAARSLVDMLFHQGDLGSPVLHLENPVRQSAKQIMTLISSELGHENKAVLPFDEWLELVKGAGLVDSLSDFFEHDFRALALGQIVLDTTGSRRVSPTLRGSSGLTREVVAKYVDQWKQKGLFVEEK